jgi:biotin--protein ligase
VKREVIVARILGMFLVNSLMLSKFRVEHFERLQKELEENGFPGVRNEYISHWMHSGSRVSVSESLNNANSNVQLTITGLTDMGMLTAVDAYGNMFELQPDGNSLDFLAGMIRKKIL